MEKTRQEENVGLILKNKEAESTLMFCALLQMFSTFCGIGKMPQKKIMQGTF